MKTILHKSEDRGRTDHGWLLANHSFSFGNFYDANKLGFGALRVLNDDCVAAGQGFGSHPHKNMEIITLVQQGSLEHKDSMGNGSLMQPNDVQVMSAGTGVFHSEFNPDKQKELKLFQIWILPDKKDVAPRYEQKTFLPQDRLNKWQQIICPADAQTDSSGIFIYQQSWFSLIDLQANQTIDYLAKLSTNGIYVFMIDGQAQAAQQMLDSRDGLAITETDKIEIIAVSNTKILVIEVPV